ncbi:MAG: type II toxin-antitoxin system VapC family toxin [Armatimonadota bacterium]
MTTLPTTCVVDASVGIKLFLQEDYSEDVQQLFKLSLTDMESMLIVPDLFFIECTNILWKKVRRGELPEEIAQENVIDLRLLDLQSISTRELMERALEIACIYSITAYDACYAALAEREDIPLVTADKRLGEALPSYICKVVLLC